MAPLKVEQYVVGPVQTNCYFAINDDTKEVLVIDPGASADQLAKKICQEKLTPIAILLTHGHFDHAGGAEELAKHFDIKIYAEEHEKETLDTPSLNLSGWEGVQKTYHADTGNNSSSHPPYVPVYGIHGYENRHGRSPAHSSKYMPRSMKKRP